MFLNTAKTTTGKKIVKDGVFIIKEIKKPEAALCGLLTANSITLLTPSIIYCKIIVSNSQIEKFVINLTQINKTFIKIVFRGKYGGF